MPNRFRVDIDPAGLIRIRPHEPFDSARLTQEQAQEFIDVLQSALDYCTNKFTERYIPIEAWYGVNTE